MMSAKKTKQNKKQETAFNKNGASGTTAQLVGTSNSAGSENTYTAPHKTKGQGGCHIISTLTSGYTAKE